MSTKYELKWLREHDGKLQMLSFDPQRAYPEDHVKATAYIEHKAYTNLLEQAMKVREAYYEYTISKDKNDLDKVLTELCNFLEGKHGN